MGTEAGFGPALRRLRTRRGLSLAELSRLTHYSKGYLSNIENGRKPATVDVARRLDDVLGGSLSDLVDTLACPYLGLAAFGPGDTKWFFGRERTTAALAGRIADSLESGLPLVVIGASGAGKSSVLHAGLRPALAGGVLPVHGSASWPVLVMTPTADPVGALSERAAKLLGSDVAELADSVRSRHWGSALRTALGPGRARLVVVVDQFEEVFTLCADEAERRDFIAALCDRSGAALVVLGVRADFYSRCLAYPELLEAVQNNQFVVDTMSDAELVEAITGPARAGGLELEPGLVEVLLRDLGPRRDSMLPLLSHALLTTWQQRTGNRLTVAGYQLTGGIHGAVAATAERVYASFDDDGRQAVRRLLLQLVNVGEDEDTRRRGDRDRLAGSGGPSAAALDALAEARLVTLDRSAVQITHEALLRAWPRLRDWIEADRTGLRIRQRLTEAAESWDGP
ncbi:MAG TPA: XRE family transcriptional regulator, partial [Amycolatopsis sp.]|nr:XRE family transcriptional regulator [Amycolatopsis sp.]